MVFKHYQTRNNVIGEIDAGLSSGTTSLILKAIYADIFPEHGGRDYLATLEELNELNRVAKREIVRVTGKSGNVLTIVRSAGYCLASYDATTYTNTALSFASGSSIALNIVTENDEDIKDELIRLETEKVSDSVVVHNTGDETVNGVKTFGSLPKVPITTPTQDEEVISKKYFETVLADVGGSSLKNEEYLTGENLINGDSLFIEGPVQYSSFSELAENLNSSFSYFGSSTTSYGIKFQAKTNLFVKTITKNGSVGATRATLRNNAGTVLETVNFSGGIATFTTGYIFQSGEYFRIEVDNNGATFAQYSFTITPTLVNLTAISGSQAGSDYGSYYMNISDITTQGTMLSNNVGDTNANKRVGTRMVGSGVSTTDLYLGLSKQGSPAGPLNFRFETDNAGSPSGTLVDANSYFSVASASILSSVGFSYNEFCASINSSWGSYSTSHGLRIQAQMDTNIINVTKYSSTNAVSCRIYTDAYVLLGTATFSGNIATFTTPIPITNGTYYRVELNNNGSSFNNYYASSVSFPITRTALKFTGGSIAGVNSIYALNIEYIATATANKITLGTPITIPEGQTAWLVAYQGTYESETVDASNYYKIAYVSQDTTTRNIKLYNSSWSSSSGKFVYINSTICKDYLLSKTSASYSYKLPDIIRLSNGAYNSGQLVKYDFEGISKLLSGMVSNSYYYLGNTPGTIGLTYGTYKYLVGMAILPTQLKIYSNMNIYQSAPTTSLNLISSTSTTLLQSSAYQFLKSGFALFNVTVADNNSGYIGSFSIQYSYDNSTWLDMFSWAGGQASLNYHFGNSITLPVFKGIYYRTRLQPDGAFTSSITLQSFIPLPF